jgi:hypothetical protein
LPDKIFDRINIPVDPEYKALAKSLAYQEPRAITLLHKLREVSDGFLYRSRDDGTIETVEIADSPKEQALQELLEFYEDTHRIVVYAGFTASLVKIKNLCSRLGWIVEVSQSGHTFSQSFLEEFDSNSERKIAAVAYPGCVYGLNLSKTPALIYYSNTFNADERIQSLERRDRPGMDLSKGTRIIDLIHLPSDELVLQNIEHKISLQKITLEEIQKCLDGI